MTGRIEQRGDVAILWINHPPVNAINTGVKRAIVEGLAAAAANPDTRAVVIACEGRTFIAGADVKEFGSVDLLAADVPDALGALTRFPKPLVAAMHGTALGGGLEIALACDYRLATPTAKLGLPEVNLGLMPGWGGTQRLPRLVGAPVALDMMLSGKPVGAQAALTMGLVDAVVDGDLVTEAVAYVQERAAQGLRRVDERVVEPATATETVFADARERMARERRQEHAPGLIIEAVQAARRLSVPEGLALEQELFMRCMRHPQSAALQHAFFAERQAAQVPGLPEGARARPVERAAVVGAGTMGGGIAMTFANAGIPVVLIDSSQESLDRGLASIRRNYDASARRGRLSAAQVEQRMALIEPNLSFGALANADFIVEAVFELMSVKKEVFARIDQVARQGAVLASNTSFLSIDEIASATSRPQDVVGTHFFAPANVMRLLEVVRGSSATSPQTLATAMALAKRLGKVGVVAGNCDGFIGNRMVNAYLHQADLLILEGAKPHQVDRALVNFGMAMGPFQIRDLSNFDGLPKMRRDRGIEAYDPRIIAVCERLVEMGRHGQKTSAGYYDYDRESAKRCPSPVAEQVISDVAREFGIAQREIGDEEIVERCLLAMANLGFDILDERMAIRASDIDVVYLTGYGFPAWRGGPMYWAEHELGLPQALDKLRRFSQLTGERWLKPAALLERLVTRGLGLEDTEQATAVPA